MANFLLLTLLLRGIKDKFIYHQIRLDNRNFMKDIIGCVNLYANYGAKVVKIEVKTIC